jgi:hypothetical protein
MVDGTSVKALYVRDIFSSNVFCENTSEVIAVNPMLSSLILTISVKE